MGENVCARRRRPGRGGPAGRGRTARAQLQRCAAGELGQRRGRRSPRRSGSRRPPAGRSASDGGRSFRAPLPTNAFRRAQVAQATLLADGKTLVAMPTVWSAQQFTPPRWSGDGGATWHPGALARRRCALRLREHAGLRRRVSGHRRSDRSRTAWFCQGNLYVTHDAGRTWAVATPRLKRPWHCAALAIAPGKQHTLILLVQSKAKNPKRVPGRLLRSVDGGATWQRLKAPRYPQLDYNGHALVFDPAQPSTPLMIAATTAPSDRSTARRTPASRGSACDPRAAARRRRRPVRVHERRPRARARAHRRPPESHVRVARRRRALERRARR